MRLLPFPGLSDWPFAVKMGLPPALALTGVVFLGLLGAAETGSQARLIQRVAGQDMAAAIQLLQATAELQGANARLYRLLALNAAGGTPLDNASEIAALRTRLDPVRAGLAGVQIQVGGAPAAALGHARTELLHYLDAIAGLPPLLGHDVNRAVAAVQPFDALSRRLVIDLSQVADDVRHDAELAAARSAAKAARLNAVFAAASLAVLALVTACAVTITRRTVLAMQRIARATLLVANGDQSLEVHKLARRDELGAIVESLRAFQSNNKRITFLAHHDGLTALPNRILFRERLTLALAAMRLGAADGPRCAVHCLDLDHFKAVNDTLGHPVGDALLQCVAARLVHCVRETDTVARLGGDEFAIIQTDVDGAQDAAKFAERIIATISRPYDVNGHQIVIGTSIGIALAQGAAPPMPPGTDVSPDTLPCHADMALYRAKAEGRCTWRIYEPEMDAALHQRRLLELDMRAALAGQQFELYYQPLVNVQTHEVNGLEALIRWHHPERGMITPADFIPLAEETGLIVQIGGWVLRQACQDAATWPATLKVSVNLSPLQFRDSNLVSLIQQALTASGLPAWRLELEITESVLLNDSDAVLATLNRLRAMGICIAMDDFGNGYASVSYLRSFRFDKIKIDRSFIRDLADGSQSSAIVRAVTGLGSTLGIKTTAAGVETEDQLARLSAEGCTEVQGYLFSPPCPAGDVARVVADIGRFPAAALVPVEAESV
jgi:diguanylate cyclase (GGDEF)-like protein